MTYSSLSDNNLLELLQNSDQIAFTEIYNRYWKKLCAIAFNLTKDESSATEIVQDLFVGIWERRVTFYPRSMENYLSVAVRFSFYKKTERERRRKYIESEACISGFNETDLEKIIETKFLEEYLHAQIDRLPKQCRLVFKSSRLNKLTNREIAQQLSLSEKTVEGHLTKSLKLLKGYLNESGLFLLVSLLYFLQKVLTNLL
ncbi:MAG: RNA polymerase sigma-70 factor [Arachidicoccus sp.]|nr:RNA polymerase sigma-70 factor [Arachidicoccus sp.]